MADIFLSYASEDRERIAPLVRLLEDQGWSVWWDRHIGTGETFDTVIERELDAAGCVVVVWTANSVSSRWVRNEAFEGLERNILAPVLLESIKPPLAFRSTQAVDLIGWPGQQHEDELAKLMADIRRLAGTRAASQPPGSKPADADTSANEVVLAILPLTDLTAAQNMAYICDGLAEDLMNALFSVDGVRVLSARDTFAFRDSSASIREIGESLKASLVLEGSVRQTGDRIVVNSRLIEVASGGTLYSERFVRSLEDPIEMQTEIAGSVFEGLREHLGIGNAQSAGVETAPLNPLAYQVYQRAQNPDDSPQLRYGELRHIASLECAIALDPNFDRAYSELAIAYIRNATVVSRQGARARAGNLLAQVKRRRPESPAVWAIEVELEGDMTSLATRSIEAILRSEGLHAYPHPTGWHDVRAALGRAIAHSGLHAEGFEYFAQLDRRSEPNRYDNWLHQLGCLVAMGEFDRALNHAQRMKTRVPEPGPLVPVWEFVALVASGRLTDAEELLPTLAQWRIDLGEQVLGHLSSGAQSTEPETKPEMHESEMPTYALLATGQLDAGLAQLRQDFERAEETQDRHWISFRLPIFRHLFSKDVIEHPDYRRLINDLHLDVDSRTRLQQQVAELEPITGIGPAPLLDI